MVTRQAQGKYVAMPVSDRGLVHRLYENHFQVNNKKTQSSGNMAKMGLDGRDKHQNTKYYRNIVNALKRIQAETVIVYNFIPHWPKHNLIIQKDKYMKTVLLTQMYLVQPPLRESGLYIRW